MAHAGGDKKTGEVGQWDFLKDFLAGGVAGAFNGRSSVVPAERGGRRG
jgi:hypothetical protein